MKSYRFFCVALAFAAGAAMAAAPVRAQASTTPAVTAKQKPPKAIWMKAEVVHADARTMIVREQDNTIAIHTFTYAAGLQDRMRGIEDNGGYQSGDKVKILYMPGQTVALKIRGTPSTGL
jgi:hypothetical protein